MDNSVKNHQNTKYFWAAITVLALLSGGLGYLYLQEKALNNQKQVKIDAQIKEQVFVTGKLDSMSRELSFKIAEVQKLGGDITSLQLIKTNLENDKKQIINQKNINFNEYEQKIKNYEVLIAKKDVDIQKLREENGILATKNENLNLENTSLKTDKIKLSDSINVVEAKNQELANKVTQASALRAETINVYAVSARGKEREGGSYSARRVDKIRISFRLVDNPLTKQEDKEIIIRLLDPQGTIISDNVTGSGIFTYNGLETIYTAKKHEQYTNSHQLVEFLYARGQEYKKGKYSIELYCEGFKIGQGSFDVK
jgi:hypothetical protein